MCPLKVQSFGRLNEYCSTEQHKFTLKFKGYTVDVTENVGVLCTWHVQIQNSAQFELSKAHKHTTITGCFNNTIMLGTR